MKNIIKRNSKFQIRQINRQINSEKYNVGKVRYKEIMKRNGSKY
jgi:hypothetical protein